MSLCVNKLTVAKSCFDCKPWVTRTFAFFFSPYTSKWFRQVTVSQIHGLIKGRFAIFLFNRRNLSRSFNVFNIASEVTLYFSNSLKATECPVHDTTESLRLVRELCFSECVWFRRDFFPFISLSRLISHSLSLIFYLSPRGPRCLWTAPNLNQLACSFNLCAFMLAMFSWLSSSRLNDPWPSKIWLLRSRSELGLASEG